MRIFVPSKTPKAGAGRVRLSFQMQRPAGSLLSRGNYRVRRSAGRGSKKFWTSVGKRKVIYVFLVASGAFITASSESLASSISPEDFVALASRCAPSVSVSMLKAVADTESNFEPLVIHDNTAGQKLDPINQVQAQAYADKWVRRGDSVDLGLMQINSKNFPALGLTIESAFDPCASLAAGAAVLRAAYGGGNTPAEQQVALLMALSRYNTGSPLRGIMNGYTRTVLMNTGKEGLKSLGSFSANVPISGPAEPPAWNIAESGVYAEAHGAPWLILFSEGMASTSLAR